MYAIINKTALKYTVIVSWCPRPQNGMQIQFNTYLWTMTFANDNSGPFTSLSPVGCSTNIKKNNLRTHVTIEHFLLSYFHVNVTEQPQSILVELMLTHIFLFPCGVTRPEWINQDPFSTYISIPSDNERRCTKCSIYLQICLDFVRAVKPIRSKDIQISLTSSQRILKSRWLILVVTQNLTITQRWFTKS